MDWFLYDRDLRHERVNQLRALSSKCKFAGTIVNCNLQNDILQYIVIHKYDINAKWILKKQSPGGVLYKRCSQKFRKIHRKTPVPESLFK